MIHQRRQVECVLIDPPDEIPDPYQEESAHQATEMHEVYPPLGLAYIAAVLRENGIQVSIIEARTRGLSHDDVVEVLRENTPDFVGITVITSRIKSALYLSDKIKDIREDIKLILGGPHIHFQHKRVIDHDSVDFCVRGEGEFTLLELINTLSEGGDPAEVKGITFKQDKEVVVTPDRPFAEDLDTLAFPARDLLHNPAYTGSWTEGEAFSPILTTRGCPYHCEFCAAPAMWGRVHRRRSVENALDELEYIYKKFDIKYVRFVDDLLLANRKWALELCTGLSERGLDDLAWACDGRVGLMSEELLTALKRANCRVIFYGIEFGNQRILDFCKKGFTIEQVRETIDMTSKAGIFSYGYFMLGYPTETVETIEDTINLAKELALNHGMDSAGFSIVTPFPGTPLYGYCETNDMLKTTDWSQYSYQLGEGVIKLKNVPEDELKELYERALYEFQFREQLRQFT